MRRMAFVLIVATALVLPATTLFAQGASGTSNTGSVGANTGVTADVTSRPDGWRYVLHGGRWWYWTAENTWLVWTGANWTPYQSMVSGAPLQSSPYGTNAASPYWTGYGNYSDYGTAPGPSSYGTYYAPGYNRGTYYSPGFGWGGDYYGGYGWSWGPGISLRVGPGGRF